MNPIWINSKTTGGHYCFKTDNSKKPFENPMTIYKKIKLYHDDIVCDIGAYVGEYSLYAYNMKVKKIFSYEPTKETFRVLTLNKKPNMEIFNKAVVGDERTSVILHISKGIGVTNSIVKFANKAQHVSVDAINYKEVTAQASVVKIDVEGAEYTYPIIQNNIRALIIEFHPISNMQWKEKAENIIMQILNNGFKQIYRPTYKSGWDLTGCWQR